MTEQERKRNRAKAAKLRPKPQELPSGQWRCQVVVNGVRKSVVDADPVIAHSKAIALRDGYLSIPNPSRMTVGAALSHYIDGKSAILSPSTLYEYRRASRPFPGSSSPT